MIVPERSLVVKQPGAMIPYECESPLEVVGARLAEINRQEALLIQKNTIHYREDNKWSAIAVSVGSALSLGLFLIKGFNIPSLAGAGMITISMLGRGSDIKKGYRFLWEDYAPKIVQDVACSIRNAARNLLSRARKVSVAPVVTAFHAMKGNVGQKNCAGADCATTPYGHMAFPEVVGAMRRFTPKSRNPSNILRSTRARNPSFHF